MFSMLSKIAFVIGLMVGHALSDGQVLDDDITETTYFNQDAQPAAITTVEGQGFFNPESRVNFDDSGRLWTTLNDILATSGNTFLKFSPKSSTVQVNFT